MDSLQRFTPMGCVTGIGSLPHRNAGAAIRFIEQYSPAAPFWPQLPQRSRQESMVDQALAPFMDLLAQRNTGGYGYSILPGCRERFTRRLDEATACLRPDCAVGFFAFERALDAGGFPNAVALKGQFIGPFTLACQLFDGDAPRAVIYEDAENTDGGELRRAIGWYVTRVALWQIQRLERFKLPLMLFIDEPCLYLLSQRPSGRQSEPFDAMLQEVRNALTMVRVAGAFAGLHCCAKISGATVRLTRPDIISFDAHENLETFCADKDAQAFMAQGGLTAFGLIPTWRDLTQLHATRLVSRWLLACSELLDLPRIALTSLVTATCGLGLLDEASARQSFLLAQRVGSRLRRIAEDAIRSKTSPAQ
ncbi:MAG: hypothetical protein M1140_03205 [Chloroflexi bacterium]|nr:hypothetical protein [Chloroflexota bacterium]